MARILFTAEKENYIKRIIPVLIRKNRKIREFFTADEIKILGPVKAPLEKINKKFRYHMIYKGKDPEMISKAVNILLNGLKLSSSISLSVDIDPLSLM